MTDDVIKYIIGQLRGACWEEEAAAVEALVKERDGIREVALREAAGLARILGVHPELNTFGGGPEWHQHGKRIAYAIEALIEEPK